MRSPNLLLLALLGTALAGCPKDKPPDAPLAVEQAFDSTQVTAGESRFLLALTATVMDQGTPEQAAKSAAAAAAATFKTPLGKPCATATQVDSRVTYQFNKCAKLSGTVVVIFGLNGENNLHVHVGGTGLSLGATTIDIDTDADLVFPTADTKEMRVTTHGSATGPAGHRLQRDGRYVVSVETGVGCVGLDGTWKSQFDAVAWDTKVAGFRQCEDMCPVAGGSVVLDGPNDTITIDFDGTAIAEWTDTNGGHGKLRLRCGPVA
jgi:hypothetical protein